MQPVRMNAKWDGTGSADLKDIGLHLSGLKLNFENNMYLLYIVKEFC